jgi:hypothetical protein
VLGRLRDRHPAVDSGGEHRVVRDRPEHGSVGDYALDTGIFRWVPVADEIGLKHDPPPARHQRTEWIPVRRSEAGLIESEAAERRPHRRVDVVRRARVRCVTQQSHELRVRLSRTERW